MIILLNSDVAAGLLAAVFSLAQFVTSFLWGVISNIIGRKPVILFGSFVSFISMVWFGLAPTYAYAVSARYAAVTLETWPAKQLVDMWIAAALYCRSELWLSTLCLPALHQKSVHVATHRLLHVYLVGCSMACWGHGSASSVSLKCCLLHVHARQPCTVAIGCCVDRHAHPVHTTRGCKQNYASTSIIRHCLHEI